MPARHVEKWCSVTGMTPIAVLAERIVRRSEQHAAQATCAHDYEPLVTADWMGAVYAKCVQCEDIALID
jgi:hypothetical protein